MARLQWNQPGDRLFETGVDRVVLYPHGWYGVPWNGVVSIAEENDGGELDPLYYDGVKYADIAAAEEFKAALTAFASPVEFGPCEGLKSLAPGLSVGHQPRIQFDLSYRTLIGNDLVGTDYGYKLHLIYNCTASAAGRAHQSLGAKNDADTRSWSFSTVPNKATNHKPTAHAILDSTKTDPAKLAFIESMLYGTGSVQPHSIEIEDLIGLLA